MWGLISTLNPLEQTWHLWPVWSETVSNFKGATSPHFSRLHSYYARRRDATSDTLARSIKRTFAAKEMLKTRATVQRRRCFPALVWLIKVAYTEHTYHLDRGEMWQRCSVDHIQSVGRGVRVCKSVCIEEKITERKVADYVASEEQNATPNSCDQQPSVLLFSPLYTRTYIHEPPFRHSDHIKTLALGTKIDDRAE